MSLKLEIETWVAALAYYDNNEFDDAIEAFDKIADTSKILFNMGVIHATLGEHERAIECYQRATRLDKYLAVAHFQQGVSNFLLGEFEAALVSFNDTLLYLRGNVMIDYAQLGLLFKLYSCEVLFNRGLCYIYLQQKAVGMKDLTFAAQEKVVEDHNVIDEAISEEAEGYTVFSIPVGVVYRPNEAKVRNLKAKDYLGKARLVATSDRSNAFTGFTGSEIKNAVQKEVKDDRPADNISFAATNLVKTDIQLRQQQSESPTSRNVFPPTPPPENDRPNRGSMRNGSRPTPAKLTIQTQDTGRKYEKAPSSEDGRTARSASASSASRVFFKGNLPPMQRRPTIPIEEEDKLDTVDLYDLYQDGGGGSTISGDKHPSTRSRQLPRYMDEDDGSDYDDGSFDGPEFEIVTKNGRRQGSRSDSRTSSRRPGIRKIRVKVHAGDIRYIMIGTAIEFPDFVDRIKDKFGLRRRFKIKTQDEDTSDGEMITIGDQDDLEMAVQSATNLAKRQRQDVPKLEIWISDV
ncbi:NADPH oxidase regulator NoxR [Metarhizium album ARSEF 1941]|uniref:NADPH oxidase regulator NoxR n=1 Tax=Metarhizium album (strain ARSEF 1941) TaxID=1081103 RepID=A0A0B2X795_METAS|nr:NADPH oxidase regulator NoxR [Metarhizium album ARSEF 1941]KHO01161.1 NADPH oxidase regulator NoxR [Metarhizium album ARSEF 1941]